MRYTKLALAIFGLGLVAGFVIVVGEFGRMERVASALMALGLLLLPVAVIADGRGMAVRAWLAARLPRGTSRKPRAKARPVAAARRKPASRPAARRKRKT